MPDFAKALKRLRDRDRQPYLTGLSPVAAFSLSEQLQFLKPLPSNRTTTNVPVFQEGLPAGESESTSFGSHYVVRKSFADDYYHGKVRLSRFCSGELQQLMKLMKQRAEVGERDRIVFLDTETTGVHGGTGICPFLVGVGHFSGSDFKMIQYFIRDFDEEPSMLLALGEFLTNFDLVVTYNGATFDVPLLETRFTLARLDNPFERLGHFDLLNTARRLWRNGHGSCRLIAMERLMSFMRGPDVPGAAIHRVYFDFLQHRPTPQLAAIFTHNTYDVVSLAALTLHACDCVGVAAPAALDDPLDLYSLARVLENSANWRRSISLYEMALGGGLPEPTRTKALENLSVIYRRIGDNQRSFEICEELMRSDVFSLLAYEGAAIHHERIESDVEAALQVIEVGLKRLDGFPHVGLADAESGSLKRWRALLRSRWERLQQKVIGFPASEIA